MVPILDLSAQTALLRPEIERAFAEILTSGRFILGSQGELLEQEVAQVCQSRYGIAVASGTDALHLILRACGLKPGDEVITSSFSFIATAEAISYCGATPVFADIDPRTFNLAPQSVAQRITKRTRAILPVHLFGQAADMDPLLELARDHHLFVIEDCAQAIGTLYRGQAVGSLGLGGCLSFYPTKNLGAFGDGGMVVTSSLGLNHRLKQLRTHGSKTRYLHEEVGYTSRLDELQAAVLRIKLPHLARWNAARAQVAQFYNQSFADLPVLTPYCAPFSNHTYHQYTLRTAHRDQVVAELKALGIGTMVYYPVPIHLQKAYRALGYQPGDLPHTERVAQEVFSLPIFPEMTHEQQEQVAQAVRKVLWQQPVDPAFSL
ncbi:DegT/DnrJ/EryC1/StrS family aminotransferase [Anthocerotibacter panamensis]|uniref:DegT/DnrJ/EryC1/StrS family aminotransferase n=1 Tax=Anthocerotibacter panamensis TaxID=2857077 RepID=UPI001C40815B|nr:DegT/DnrJ/EryC1/StrS family aminotransferase [Anthocerotibacter panamensis]